jgi:phosphate starvation-inducible PhoH-like protein
VVRVIIAIQSCELFGYILWVKFRYFAKLKNTQIIRLSKAYYTLKVHQKTFALKGIDPIEIYGAGNKKLKQIQALFPKLKIIARGDIIMVEGDAEILELFEEKYELFIAHLNKFHKLTEANIESLMMDDGATIIENNGGADVIVHGNNGQLIKAKTANQRSMVAAVTENDLIFAIGPAGTGKTYTAVALAVRALKNREVKRIILTRPAVEAGENLGFLPGDLKEKLDPYLQPLYDALRDMIPNEKLLYYFENGIIQIAPLAFMRGRTLDRAFVILDEAQNASTGQLKMFLTRMGKTAKFIVTGDQTQIDLPKRQQSGLLHIEDLLKNIKGIAFIHLDESDVVRHRLVKRIINAYKSIENE